MSTRANIIVKDVNGDELIFYRHSDGYPEGALSTLEKFLGYVKDNRIRDNVGQAAGWLIVLGRDEYHGDGLDGMGWKVGSIEPTTCLHSDIDYLYVVDLGKKKITHRKAGRDSDYNTVIPRKFYGGKFNPVTKL